MATFNKFNDFSEQLARGAHDFDGTLTYKVALTNTLPTAAQTTWNVTDHPAPAAANGYTAGGTATTLGISETGGTTTVTGTQVVFSATAGGIGPFQYAILYCVTGALPVGWWAYPSSTSLADGETLTVKFSNTSPGAFLTLAI